MSIKTSKKHLTGSEENEYGSAIRRERGIHTTHRKSYCMYTNIKNCVIKRKVQSEEFVTEEGPDTLKIVVFVIF